MDITYDRRVIMDTKAVNAIAIHLPQFHPIPENDKWWGKGFTEWTNVVKARPMFKGHYQPHLPADLGFYDLRLNESLREQAALAKEYGIYGFCYYHYWFNGKRLLNVPLDNMLATGKPDFPFMLCWANENWTRRWDGMDQEVLMKQEYSREDDIKHIRFLIDHFFADDRYIKVDDKPFILIYRPQLFPDIRSTLDCWRNEAIRAGLKGLYIGYMQTFGFKESPEVYGFDYAVQFQPHLADTTTIPPPVINKILHKLHIFSSVHYSHSLISYEDYVNALISVDREESGIYKCVCPMWDNSARRKRHAAIFKGSTPEIYQKWLQHAATITQKAGNPGKFLFINAWNEWAEGNHLEPCQKWGRSYLEVTRKTLGA